MELFAYYAGYPIVYAGEYVGINAVKPNHLENQNLKNRVKKHVPLAHSSVAHIFSCSYSEYRKEERY